MTEINEVCTGVVDGGMFVTDGGRTVILAGVRVPRLGLPGGAALRMLLQRAAMDQPVRIVAKHLDGYGHLVADVWAGDNHLNEYVNRCKVEYGYREGA